MSTRKGYNNNDLKYRNRGIVLRLIANESLSRVDITKRIGLTRMTVTNIVNELIEENYIVEGEVEEKARAGRNPVFLEVSKKSPLALGLHIGRNLLSVILTDIKLNCLYSKKISLENESTESLKKKIYQLIDGALKYYSDVFSERTLLGLGISSMGPVDPVKGEILNPIDFFSISDLPLCQLLKKKYKIPVYIENDMNASALAEHLKGCGKNCESFVYLGITNGIGAGVIVNHHLYGKDSISVGEIGHMSINFDGPVCSCGNRGCLESYAKMPVILERLKKASGNDSITYEDFLELSEDPACDEVFLDVIEKFAVALVNAVNLLDPERIVIGHEGVFLPQKYLAILQEQIEKRILSKGYREVKVLHSAFSLSAPLYGSAAIILNRLFSGQRI